MEENNHITTEDQDENSQDSNSMLVANTASNKQKETSKKLWIIFIIVMVFIVIVAVVLIVVFTQDSSKKQSQHTVYYTVFSHNNYEQAEPLFNATSLYVGWIEADIFLTNISDTDLFVAHTKDEIMLNRTLQSMYLDPLKQLIDKYDSLWPDKYTTHLLNLMIDIKTDATDTYNALHNLISNKYAKYVTSWNQQTGVKTQRYINIVISGNRNFDAVINQQNERFISLDGRLDNLLNPTNITKNYEYMPVISDRFPSKFPDYNASKLYLNNNDTIRLAEYISMCKDNNQYLRLWALPTQIKELMKQISDLDETKNIYVFNTDYPKDTVDWMLENDY